MFLLKRPQNLKKLKQLWVQDCIHDKALQDYVIQKEKNVWLHWNNSSAAKDHLPKSWCKLPCSSRRGKFSFFVSLLSIYNCPPIRAWRSPAWQPGTRTPRCSGAGGGPPLSTGGVSSLFNPFVLLLSSFQFVLCVLGKCHFKFPFFCFLSWKFGLFSGDKKNM